MSAFRPNWWHHHGIKFGVGFSNPPEDELSCAQVVLRSTVGEVTIRPNHLDIGKGQWNVSYRLRHPCDALVAGQFNFAHDELQRAFMGRNGAHDASRWMLDRYAADAASQGHFIRCGNYLNIPGPGTGNDGDANISIYVDETIADAIQALAESVMKEA